MNCKQCGKKIGVGQRFCESCGVAVTNNSAREMVQGKQYKTMKLLNRRTINLSILSVIVIIIGTVCLLREPILEVGFVKLSEFYQDKNFEKAIKWAQKAHDLNEENTALEFLYAAKGESLIEHFPDKAQNYLLEASRYGMQGEYNVLIAKAYLKDAEMKLEFDPEEALTLVGKAMEYDKNKKSVELYATVCVAMSEKVKFENMNESIQYLKSAFLSDQSDEIRERLIDAFLMKAQQEKLYDLNGALETLKEGQKYGKNSKFEECISEIEAELEFEKMPAITAVETTFTSYDYLLPMSNVQKLTWADIKHLSTYELRIARNEIYARHGYSFKTEEMRSYFNTKNWYFPNASFKESDLNAIEKYNINFIRSYE